VTSLRLHLPSAGTADPRLRLDEGVVLGGGVVVEVASPLIYQPAPTPRKSARPAVNGRPSAGRPSAPARSVPAAEPVADVVPEQIIEPAAPEPAFVAQASPPAPAFPAPTEVAEPPMVEADVVEPALPHRPVMASVSVESGVGPGAGSGSGSGSGSASGDGEQPRLSFLRDRDDLPGFGSGDPAGPNGVGGPGAMTLDDGTTFALDSDYLVGRDPRQDPEVIAGVVKALRVADPDGVISRRHARITVVAGQVRVFDLGSANGTFMELPGDPQRHRLTAGEPTVLTPGARVIMGRRWLRYDP
jgi:hypothetical protein